MELPCLLDESRARQAEFDQKTLVPRRRLLIHAPGDQGLTTHLFKDPGRLASGRDEELWCQAWDRSRPAVHDFRGGRHARPTRVSILRIRKRKEPAAS